MHPKHVYKDAYKAHTFHCRHFQQLPRASRRALCHALGAMAPSLAASPAAAPRAAPIGARAGRCARLIPSVVVGPKPAIVADQSSEAPHNSAAAWRAGACRQGRGAKPGRAPARHLAVCRGPARRTARQRRACPAPGLWSCAAAGAAGAGAPARAQIGLRGPWRGSGRRLAGTACARRPAQRSCSAHTSKHPH